MNCRLCLHNELEKIQGADDRAYYLCNKCSLVNVSSQNIIDRKEEKERYLSHKNGIDQPGYVEFLNRAVEPAIKYLRKDMMGLDYGCGYAPTLSILLERKGYRCENYDPYFVSNKLNKKYDFVFSTEVFEHFVKPYNEIERITNLLEPNGILIIMTERWGSIEKFRNWYYTRDPSHIAFYNNDTFDFIIDKYGYTKLYDDKNRVIILRKR